MAVSYITSLDWYHCNVTCCISHALTTYLNKPCWVHIENMGYKIIYIYCGVVEEINISAEKNKQNISIFTSGLRRLDPTVHK